MNFFRWTPMLRFLLTYLFIEKFLQEALFYVYDEIRMMNEMIKTDPHLNVLTKTIIYLQTLLKMSISSDPYVVHKMVCSLIVRRNGVMRASTLSLKLIDRYMFNFWLI